MAESSRSPLSLVALANGCAWAVLLQRAALFYFGVSDLFSWLSGSSLVLVCLWAMQEADTESLARDILRKMSLRKLPAGLRMAVTWVSVAVAAYTVLVPTIAIGCDRAGPVTIEPEGGEAFELQCLPERTFVRAPSGFIPSWSQTVVVKDRYQRFAYRELKPMASNAIHVPGDLTIPTGVLVQLSSSDTLGLAESPRIEVKPGCSETTPFCVFFDILGTEGFELRKNGVLFGRVFAKREVLEDRLRRLKTAVGGVDDPGEPSFFPTNKLEDLLELNGRLRSGQTGACQRFRCAIEPGEERICIIASTGGC